MKTQTINKNGIALHIESASIADGIKVFTEESEKTFDFPFDSSFNFEYEQMNEEDLVYAHESILEEIYEWAVAERAAMVAEVIKEVAEAALLHNLSGKSGKVSYKDYGSPACFDVTVWGEDNNILTSWTCKYAGELAFETNADHGTLHIGSVKGELVKFLEGLNK